MILTVTLNPALDVTYQVAALTPRSAMRVTQAHQRAGAKGVNVARVVAACGGVVCATGLAGGARGNVVRAGLREAGIRDEFAPISGEIRTGSVAVTPAGRWRVTHPRLDGNPVGAGDPLVAGLALQSAVLGTAAWTAAGWATALAQATGVAMASVLSPSAGEADPAEATRLAESVRIRKTGKHRT